MSKETETKPELEELTPTIKKISESIEEIKNTMSKLKEEIDILKDTKTTLDQVLYSIESFKDKIDEIQSTVRDYFKKMEEKITTPKPVQIVEEEKEKLPEPKKKFEIPIPASVISGIFNNFLSALKPTASPVDIVNALNNLKEEIATKIREDHFILIDIDRWVRRMRSYIAEGKIPEDEIKSLKNKVEEWRSQVL